MTVQGSVKIKSSQKFYFNVLCLLRNKRVIQQILFGSCNNDFSVYSTSHDVS